MKKLVSNLMSKLSLVAFVLALSAAFAFTAPVETLYYRDANGTFMEKQGPGVCVEDQFNCEHRLIGPAPSQDESDYEPIGEENRRFVPSL